MASAFQMPVGDTNPADFYSFYQDQVSSLMFPSSCLFHETNPVCVAEPTSGYRGLTQGLQQQELDFASPVYDNHQDGATDAAPSPISPTLPGSNTYQLPNGSAYLGSGTKMAQSLSIEPPGAYAQHSSPHTPAMEAFEMAMNFDTNALFDSEPFPNFGPMFNGADSAPYQPPAKSRKTSGTGASPAMDWYTPPSVTSDEPQYPSRKRKSSASGPGLAITSPNELEPPSPQAAARTSPVVGGHKKTAHNMIEKRYRNNLNDRINDLRDAVPSLRAAQHRIDQGHEPDGPVEDLDEDLREDLDGLEVPPKLNKATILAKAAEYITHLEKRNRELKLENSTLKSHDPRKWT